MQAAEPDEASDAWDRAVEVGSFLDCIDVLRNEEPGETSVALVRSSHLPFSDTAENSSSDVSSPVAHEAWAVLRDELTALVERASANARDELDAWLRAESAALRKEVAMLQAEHQRLGAIVRSQQSLAHHHWWSRVRQSEEI